MSQKDVCRLLLGDTRIATRIAETMGRRLAELERRLSDTLFKSVPERVAARGGSSSGEADHRGRRRRPVSPRWLRRGAALLGGPMTDHGRRFVAGERHLHVT